MALVGNPTNMFAIYQLVYCEWHLDFAFIWWHLYTFSNFIYLHFISPLSFTARRWNGHWKKKRSWGFIRWWNGKTTESSSNTNELAQGHTYIYFFLHMKSSGNITITSVFSESSAPAVMSKKIDSVAAGPLHLVYLSPRAFSAAVTCLCPRLCLTLSFSPLGFCCISWSLSPS